MPRTFILPSLDIVMTSTNVDASDFDDGRLAIPEPPSPRHTWVPNVNGANIADGFWQGPSATDSLEREREAAEIDFVDLLKKLVAIKALTRAQAQAWLNGNIPGFVANAIVGLPTFDEQIQARAEAMRDSRIARNSDLIEAIRIALGATDKAVDKLFGI